MLLALMVGALATTEVKRTFADQAVQEQWTYEGPATPENLVRKEWFTRAASAVGSRSTAGSSSMA